MTASIEFSLRDLVRQVAAESSAADPTDLAVEVLARIPQAMERPALEQALRLFVRDVVRVDRHLGQPAPMSGQDPARPSARVAGVRDAWKHLLASRISVAGKWKFMADATADDLLVVAAERRTLAALNVAKAEEFERLAAAMRERGVARLGDLGANPLVRVP